MKPLNDCVILSDLVVQTTVLFQGYQQLLKQEGLDVQLAERRDLSGKMRVPDSRLILVEGYGKFLEQIEPKQRKAIKDIATIIKDVYSQPNLVDELFCTIINHKPDAENLPLLELCWLMFPDVFFSENDVVEFANDAQKIDSFFKSQHDRNKQKIVEKLKHTQARLDFILFLSCLLKDFPVVHRSLYHRKWYRDHLLHSIRVAWLMDKTIRKWEKHYLASAKYRLEKLLLFAGKDKISAEEIAFNATYLSDNISLGIVARRYAQIAGFFHDIGYDENLVNKCVSGSGVGQLDENVSMELAGLSVPALEDPFGTYLRMHNELKVDLAASDHEFNINSNYKKIFQQEATKDHGVFAATKLQSFPIEARQAIALHNLKTPKVNFLEHPIAALLLLCDEAQEWGRSIRCDKGKHAEDFFVPVDSVQYEITENEFRFEIDLSQKAGSICRCKCDYDERILIEDKLKNLKRLILPKELGLTVEYVIIDRNQTRHQIVNEAPSYEWSYR